MSKDDLFLSRGIAKSRTPRKMFFKNFKNKVIAGIAVVALLASIFTFNGCNNSPDEPTKEDPPYSDVVPDEPTPEPTPEPAPEPTPPIVETQPLTMEEFVAEYKDNVLDFVADVFSVKQDDRYDRMGYSFEVNEEGKITAAKANTVVFDGNNRSLLIEKVTFNTPLTPDLANSGDYTAEQIAGEYSVRDLFTFDIRENYFEKELISALMEACNVSGGQNFFYQEELKNGSSSKVYYLAHVDTESNSTYLYEVIVPLHTELGVIENIKTNARTRCKAANGMGKFQIDLKEYELEGNFLPESYQELSNYFAKDFNDSLNKYFIPNVGEKCFDSFLENRINSTEWTVIQENNQITGFQLFIDYQYLTNEAMFKVVNIQLNQPLNYEDFVSEDKETLIAKCANEATYSLKTVFTYVASDQGTKEDLVNNLCRTLGLSYVYQDEITFKLSRYTLEDAKWGTCKRLAIMKKDSRSITTYVLFIKNASTDAGLIENLDNEKFTIIEHTYTDVLEGEKFIYTEENEVSTQNASKVFVIEPKQELTENPNETSEEPELE